jgi:tetratricopeptide (TPR) repeat protein
VDQAPAPADFGKAYFNARRYDEAIQQLRKTVEIDQGFFVAHHYLGSAYAMKGAFSEALSEYQKAHQLNDDPHVVAPKAPENETRLTLWWREEFFKGLVPLFTASTHPTS